MALAVPGPPWASPRVWLPPEVFCLCNYRFWLFIWNLYVGPFVCDSVGSFTGWVLGIVLYSGICQYFILFCGWILVRGMHKPKSYSPYAYTWMFELSPPSRHCT